MKTRVISSALSAIALMATVSSCTLDDSGSQTPPNLVNLKIADAPTLGDFKEVNISLASVKYYTDDGNWYTKALNTREINLLNYANGNDTLVAQLPINVGRKIVQLDVYLGSESSLVKSDGSVVALNTLSSQQYGVSTLVKSYSSAPIRAGYDLVMDFDVRKSLLSDNGAYSFSPHIRSYIADSTTFIDASFLPDTTSFFGYVVTSKNDTISSISDVSEGNYFRLSGVPNGKYVLVLETQYQNPVGGYQQGIITVKNSEPVNLGTIGVPVQGYDPFPPK